MVNIMVMVIVLGIFIPPIFGSHISPCCVDHKNLQDLDSSSNFDKDAGGTEVAASVRGGNEDKELKSHQKRAFDLYKS